MPLSLFGHRIVRDAKYRRAKDHQQGLFQLFDMILAEHDVGPSRSQLKQDVFALMQTGFKRDGYFVEFGATDGVSLSNTWLLEKRFGWRGILAEPARVWHDDLYRNRDAIIDTECVWSKTGATLDFVSPRSSEFGSIATFADRDLSARKRMTSDRYQVTTVSLNDLLDRHDAPPVIDYMSIDTEGSELDILSAFDFAPRQIRVLTVEHNYTSARQPIYELLTAQGYERVLDKASAFDDWYVLKS